MSTESYNYQHFHVRYYNMLNSTYPKAGERAPDFTAYTTEGNPVRLSDFRGQVVVLETGSISCPMYVKDVIEMNDIAKKFPDIKFLVLYVREAHPGGNIPAHKTLEDKIECARALPEQEGEQRQILLILTDSVVGIKCYDFSLKSDANAIILHMKSLLCVVFFTNLPNK
jgi:hypothetical protein